MLKLSLLLYPGEVKKPAAFGRLCVETIGIRIIDKTEEPAAFGRLCVETMKPTSKAAL